MNNPLLPSAHAASWIAAWNAHDLDAILDHYADSVVFQADTVASRWGRADGVLHGTVELREHFRRGLEMVPQLKFELEDVFTSPDGYAVLYRRENGNRVIEVVTLDDSGRAKNARAYYARPQP
jgi:hypothetical protein